jgi:hypothetical protein
MVVVDDHLGALVFAFDPVVEVELVPTSPQLYARVRYKDPGSVSASLGALFEVSSALQRVCLTPGIDKEVRHTDATKLEAEIRDIARNDPRETVATAARLALVNCQCTNAEENRALARELLDTLDPTSPAIAIWNDGVRWLGDLVGDPGRGEALRREVERSHPNPDARARLLLERLKGLDDDADPAERARIEDQLASPRLANTFYAEAAKHVNRPRDAIATNPGDPLPPVELARVDGDPIHPGEERTRRQLLYFSASTCGACIEALPKMRQFAAAHPDLRLLYVLVDTEADARDFMRQRAPVPGEVARTDIDTPLRPSVLRYVLTPSFVLTDTDGTVLATSDETKFSKLEKLLADLDPPR